MRKDRPEKRPCPHTLSGQKGEKTQRQKDGTPETWKRGHQVASSALQPRTRQTPSKSSLSLTFTPTFHRTSWSSGSSRSRLGPRQPLPGSTSDRRPLLSRARSPPLYSNSRAPVQAETAAFRFAASQRVQGQTRRLVVHQRLPRLAGGGLQESPALCKAETSPLVETTSSRTPCGSVGLLSGGLT